LQRFQLIHYLRLQLQPDYNDFVLPDIQFSVQIDRQNNLQLPNEHQQKNIIVCSFRYSSVNYNYIPDE